MKKLVFATIAFLAAVAGASWLMGWWSDSPLLVGVGKLLLIGALLLFLLWVAVKAAHRFLWRVGRRLAFSYFLIGVLPIPMVALLVLLNAYLLSGFFLGHLYRDSVATLQTELSEYAEAYLASTRGRSARPAKDPRIGVAVYDKGWKKRGDQRLPYLWPIALRGLADPAAGGVTGERERTGRFFLLPEGDPTLLALVSDGRRSVVTFLARPIEDELMERSGLWVDLLRSDDPRRPSRINLNLGGRTLALHQLVDRGDTERRNTFFAGLGNTEKWGNRPIVWWSELSGGLLSVQDGALAAEYVTAILNGSPSIVARHLLSSSAEVDAAVWGSLIAVTGLLATMYIIAAAMALTMIYTLSRAVNRLSSATESVRRGDFSRRIPVRRDDQVGELQHSFNQMSANLDKLISSAAEKEIIEKELQIARNLQQSLLPTDLPSSDTLQFATLFEPSAAIGGDYFDIFRVDDSRLAVVIADVSGHGLPTGLRMAMLKAALVILVEESKEPVEILRRLSAMVRSQNEERFFVTATVGVLDFRRGILELTNAGHPPTYLLRDGEVEEILLPGNPLGALGENYGHKRLKVHSDDVLLWLSDGLIEMSDPEGEPFGYDRIRSTLSGTDGNATAVRDRLLAAVEEHAAGCPAEDDQTLVALRYRAPEDAAEAAAEAAEAAESEDASEGSSSRNE